MFFYALIVPLVLKLVLYYLMLMDWNPLLEREFTSVYRISKNLMTVLHLNGGAYSNEGAKPKDYNTSLILHTFNIPVSGHYIYKRKYQAFLGGEIGMIMASKDPTNKENDEMMLFGDTIDFFDYRVFIGGGVFLTKSKNVALNLKYNLGLSNISAVEGVKWKRNALTLSLEYTFGYD